jgi:hypothetical protein
VVAADKPGFALQVITAYPRSPATTGFRETCICAALIRPDFIQSDFIKYIH